MTVDVVGRSLTANASQAGALDLPRLLTAKQVADRLAVSRSAIYAWVRAGQLPAVYVGRLPRFIEEDVLEFIAGRRRTPEVLP